jgi:sigma-E factor negative regulatory protein RseC
MEVEALNLADARVGDRIALTFDTSPLLKATFFIYVFPILFMMVGAVIGLHLAPSLGLNPSGCSAVGAFSFLFAAILLVRSKGNKMAEDQAYRPKITRIISS